MRRYTTSRDGNEKEIVKALRDAGVKVTRIESTLDPGVPDLLCEVDDAEMSDAARSLLSVYDDLRDQVTDGVGDTWSRDAIGCVLQTIDRRKRRWVLLEIKNPTVSRRKRGMVRAEEVDAGAYPELVKRLGKRRTMHLMYAQADFLAARTAPWAVVETVEEALAACGVRSDEKA